MFARASHQFFVEEDFDRMTGDFVMFIETREKKPSRVALNNATITRIFDGARSRVFRAINITESRLMRRFVFVRQDGRARQYACGNASRTDYFSLLTQLDFPE